MTTPAKEVEQTPPTSGSDMSVETIQRRAATGVLSLALRRVVHQIISFSGGIALARLLSPSVFGVFNLVTFVVNFFGFFGDIGFGATLIQMKEKPSERVLRTTFAIQQGLVAILMVLVFVSAPALARYEKLPQSYMWLFRAMSLSLFLTSMKVIPSVMLQRKLDFNRIIIPEIAEIMVFNAVAVTMAFFHYGVWSLVFATLSRAAAGFTILFILAPWKMGFAFDKEVGRRLVRFGGPFQLGQFFLLLKNMAIPVFATAMCGTAASGYLSWANGLALLPYSVIEIVCRVALPVCSRLQNDIPMFARTVEKNVRMAALGVFPIATLMAAMAPYAVQYIYSPKTDPTKWAPALPALYLFLAAIMASPVIHVYSNAFNALGRPKTSARLTGTYVLLGWALNIVLVYYHSVFGIRDAYNGIPWSMFLVALLCVWLPMVEMRKIASVRLAPNVWAPLVSSLLAMCLTRWVAVQVIHPVHGQASRLIPVLLIFGVTVLGMVFYVGFLLMLEGKRLLSEVSSFKTLVKAPSSPESEAAPVDAVEVAD